jgi:hypothetical protein
LGPHGRSKRFVSIDHTEGIVMWVQPLDPLQHGSGHFDWRQFTPSIIDGIPATIKDLVLTKGWPTLRGSRTVDASQSWDEDAPATQRSRQQARRQRRPRR